MVGEALSITSDSNVDPAQADQSITKPAQSVHPFFLPQTNKRIGASPGNHDDRGVPAPPDLAISTKRQKKRTDIHKPRSAKIQSFFKVKTRMVDTASIAQDIMDRVECGSSAVEVNDSLDLEVRNKTKSNNGMTKDVFGIHSQWQQTAAFRLPGTPAPYPTGDTHIPIPRYTRYASTDRLDTSSCCERIASQKIDAASSGCRGLYNSQHICVDGQEKDFDFRGHALDMPPPTPGKVDRVFSLKASTASVNAIIGHIASDLPSHLSFLEPVIDAISRNSPEWQADKAQLLAFRHRPKKASHVLANQRSAFQLRSWIEGMRIKWPNQAPGEASNNTHCAASKMAGSGKSRGQRFVSSYSFKRDRNVSNSDYDSGECYSQSAGNGDSDSSDDFMPSQATKRRPYRKPDDLHDVFAWARSNGTLSDVHDNTFKDTYHRRSGSGYTSSSETESFSNIVLITGPSGSCKTAAVYACAEECNFEVCEIHPGERRSGKNVLDALEDALLSHTIATASKGPSITPDNAANQMLILLEQIDILFEQDQRLWPALKQLALKSKRPIVLTCNDISCIRWDTACFQHVFHFQRPEEHVLVPYLFFLCLAEGALISPLNISKACRTTECDINRVLSSLEIAVRYAALHPTVTSTSTIADSSDGSTSHCVKHSDVHLEGVIAWMIGPLSSQETSESRFNFWIELIASAQTSAGSGLWYETWPDPPPQQAELFVDGSSQTGSAYLLADHNRFFSSSTSSIVGSLAETIPDAGQCNGLRPYTVCTAIPMEIPADRCTRLDHYCANSLPQLALSDLEEIERMANSLDALSFACATTGATEVHNESLYEPLYSQKATMVDGCLNVSYVTLDADVLGSTRAGLFTDGFGIDRCGGTYIDDYLRHAALRNLCQSQHGSQFSAEQVELCLKTQGISRPHGLHGAEASKSKTAQELHQALEYVGLTTRHCIRPLLVFETSSFLAKMVFWDWVHLKMVEPPSAPPNQELQCDDYEHSYRIGTRRTRRSAYRVHIKHMPHSTQESLVSWMRRIQS